MSVITRNIFERVPGLRWTSDRRIYVNATRDKVVNENSPEAAYLLVNEGGEIARDLAIRLGLVSEDKSKEQEVVTSPQLVIGKKVAKESPAKAKEEEK